MAWRAPRFAFLHAARAAGVSALSSTALSTAGPKDHLIDDRKGSLTTFAVPATNHYFQVNRGSGTLEAIDRMLIPDGHTLNGCTFRLEADDNSGMTSPTSLIAATAITSAGLLDYSFASNSERYVRITFQTSGAWSVPEWVLTRTRTLIRGPEPDWTYDVLTNDLIFTKPTGASSALNLGPDQRRLELTYRLLDDSDRTLLLDLISACGRRRPFYVDPPFDTEIARWMVMTEPMQIKHDRPAPASQAPAYRAELQLLEWIA
jgi:hypothetical protein